MIPALLAQLGLPLLIRAVGAGLGRIDDPVARTAAEALGTVEAAVTDGRIPPEAVTEANRHVERLAELDSRDHRTALVGSTAACGPKSPPTMPMSGGCGRPSAMSWR
jgi:hypothetical protein